MGRPNYKYDSTNCTGGINGQDDERLSQHQCKDALNVWAPNGVVEKRPGFVGVSAFTRGESPYSLGVLIKEDNSTNPPTYTTDNGVSLDLSGMRAIAIGIPRDRLYLGLSNAAFTAVKNTLIAFQLRPINLAHYNTNDTQFVAEYSSPEGWKPLEVSLFRNSKFLSGVAEYLYFVLPKDWSITSVNGTSAVWLRLGLSNQDLDADVEVHVLEVMLGYPSSVSYIGSNLFYAGIVQLFNTKLYLYGMDRWSSVDPRETYVVADTDLRHQSEMIYRFDTSTIATSGGLGCLVSVPDFGEVYLTRAYQTVCIKETDDRNTDKSWTDCQASIESDPDLLTEYTGIPLLPTWPKAKYTQYFRGEMWVANLEGSPYQVRWSAPQPLYKAWPELNTEFLVENDKSPITGLYGFGQNMVVFKSDSIYEMIDAGTSNNGLQTYAPERRVAGKGAVSHHTIQNISGRLVFLAEDGVYAYDGSPNVQNLGLDRETNVDRIKHIIKRVTPGARQFAVATHWSTRHCYLLALPLDGASDNTHVLCYDYENDAWWLWEMPVRIWLLDEGPSDDQELYFADKNGMVYQFDRGTTDHGATVNAYVITRQMVASSATYRAREVEVKSTNATRTLNVSIGAEDEPLDQVTPATLSYTDEAEKDYNTATYDVDKYTIERDRKKAVGVRLDGNSFRVKVEHTDKYTPFKLSKISVGYIPVGKR